MLWHATEKMGIPAILFLQVTILLASSAAGAIPTFRFANIYGNHMVMQRGPASANIWGYVPDCSPVSVTFNNQQLPAKILPASSSITGTCRWLITLPPTTSPGPYTITATSGSSTINIQDVLFGDVWLCTGGSINLQLGLSAVFNGSEEVKKAANYPNIRLFTAAQAYGNNTLEELKEILQPWTVASPEAVHSEDPFSYFSATCWFFGQEIYDRRQYPIGLIVSAYGNTTIDPWLQVNPPDCIDVKKKIRHHTGLRALTPGGIAQIYNTMLHPLFNMTIYGIVWYHGEADEGADELVYSCKLRTFVNNLRNGMYIGSSKQTKSNVPVIYVQVGSEGRNSSAYGWFPQLREAQMPIEQTPTPVDPYIMVVSMDLSDPDTPYKESYISRHKKELGRRLALGARCGAYGENITCTSPGLGPGHVISQTNTSTMIVMYVNAFSSRGLEFRKQTQGIGLYISLPDDSDQRTVVGTVVKVQGDQMFLNFPPTVGYDLVEVLYLCEQYVCDYLECPVYDVGTGLPVQQVRIAAWQ